MAHICSRVDPGLEDRRFAFREAFRPWLRCLATPGFRPELSWLLSVHANARRVLPAATRRMVWHLARWAVGIRPPVPPGSAGKPANGEVLRP
jgi:hypothetical protein